VFLVFSRTSNAEAPFSFVEIPPQKIEKKPAWQRVQAF
jgi:hypothetical protein